MQVLKVFVFLIRNSKKWALNNKASCYISNSREVNKFFKPFDLDDLTIHHEKIWLNFDHPTTYLETMTKYQIIIIVALEYFHKRNNKFFISRQVSKRTLAIFTKGKTPRL